jgi:hypothetical protein
MNDITQSINNLSVYVDKKNLVNQTLSKNLTNQMSEKLTRSIIRVVEQTQQDISNMNMIEDKPRTINTKKPGHLTSFTGSFTPQQPVNITVDVVNNPASNGSLSLLLPLLSLTFPEFSFPGVSHPLLLNQPKPNSTKPRPTQSDKKSTQLKPAPVEVKKPVSLKSDTAKKIALKKPVAVPTPQPVPLPVEPKTPPTPKKPVVIPQTQPTVEPKTLPTPKKPTGVPQTQPIPLPVEPKTPPTPKKPVVVVPIKAKPVKPKPSITLKEVSPQVFDYYFGDKSSSETIKQPDRLKNITKDSVNRFIKKSSSRASKLISTDNRFKAQRTTKPGKVGAFSKLNTGTGGLVTSVPFITLARLIENVRSGQLHEQQKSEVEMTREFNTYFVERMEDSDAVNESTIMREKMKLMNLNQSGSIKNNVTDQQAVDVIVARERKKLLDKYYDQVFMPARERQYMIQLMMNPQRSTLDDIDLQQLIETHPGHYQKHRHMWTPRKGSEDIINPDASGKLISMYDQVMQGIDNIASTTTHIDNISKPVVDYHVIDDPSRVLVPFETYTLT